ncbi:hypothetical protein J437_LFUL008697 [Ladona fulva]|uniref:GTP:AMP phosphotransferase, mitochondrial n=1 Tax=Ladona fulva TaxID=123851 RepID=A0A8K0KE68_LADFU|nr:hypothetical protein J437_LFUL008697 [Ladona fulva]
MAKILQAVILGAPASGKGTISSRIVKSFDVIHLSSGDILRGHIENQTDYGVRVKSTIEKGLLVPDDLMVTLIENELKHIHRKSWILDGFPRTRVQAEMLSTKVKLDFVINLVVDFDVLIDRIKGRWVHLPSGRVYHSEFNPPIVPGKDDITGEDLVQRSDDNAKSLHKRLSLYSEKIPPVIEFYKESKLLHNFHGKTSNEIWPKVYSFIAQFLKEEN